MNKLLLVVNVLVVFILGFIVYRKLVASDRALVSNLNTNCTYELKDFKFHYEKESVSPNVLMVGNSLIEEANWDSLLHRSDVANRGIDHDNLPCICQRMKFLQTCPAKICFIEAGIEDLRNKNADSVLAYYKRLIQLCQEQHKIPVINLVVYISAKAVKKWGNTQDYKLVNKNVFAFNGKLREYALLKGVDYIDMNPQLCVDNVLQEKFTTDGINLSYLAYSMWAVKIERVLKNHGI